MMLTAISCSDDIDSGINYPSIRLVNEIEYDEDRAIVYVGLVGYEFEILNILPGSSQTLRLENGMPGGYDNINVRIRLSGPQTVIRDVSVDFEDGETSTILFGGCVASAPECNGYTVEVE
jgi:hypothetical protein